MIALLAITAALAAEPCDFTPVSEIDPADPCSGVAVSIQTVAEVKRMRADIIQLKAEVDALKAKLEVEEELHGATRLDLRAAEYERDFARAELKKPGPILQRPGVCEVKTAAVIFGAAAGWGLMNNQWGQQ